MQTFIGFHLQSVYSSNWIHFINMHFTVLVFLITKIALSFGAPQCKTPFETIVSSDCSTLWRCIAGHPMRMSDCMPGQTYSKIYHVCVWKDSELDDCKETVNAHGPCHSKPCQNGGICQSDIGEEKNFLCNCPPTHTGPLCETEINTFPASIKEVCAMDSSLIIPHPTKCQLYYNCSQVYDSVPRFFEQHLMECPYPQLFSESALECRHFRDVNCGHREEIKDSCDYLSHKCPVAHCRPCFVDTPSCAGKPDGMHPHGYKINSPWYMECDGERTTKTGLCPLDSNGRYMFVNNGRCSSGYFADNH